MFKRRKTMKRRFFGGFIFAAAVIGLVLCLAIASFASDAAEDISTTVETGEVVTLADKDGDGYYDIGTADELYAFSAAVGGGRAAINGELISDITLSEERMWVPIGNAENAFVGKFNGNGKAIVSLYYKSTDVGDGTNDNVGLFGIIGEGGLVENVTLKSPYIGYNGRYYGGIAGKNAGTIRNCHNLDGELKNAYHNIYTGSSVSSSDIGGIVGLNTGSVEKCTNTSDLGDLRTNQTITSLIGGIAAQNNGGQIIECVNEGSIVANAANVGGIAARAEGNFLILNCLNSGSVSSAMFAGGIVSSAGQREDQYNGTDMGYIVNCLSAARSCNATDLNRPYEGGIVGLHYIDMNGLMYMKGFTVANCYYKEISNLTHNCTRSVCVSKTADELLSGEVAYLLAKGCTVGEGETQITFSADVWGQSIKESDSDTEFDSFPTLGAPSVYTRPSTCKDDAVTGYSNDSSGTPASHNAEPATCTEPSVCNDCKEVVCGPLGHDMSAAICAVPATCKRGCGYTEGEPDANEHSYESVSLSGGERHECTLCGYAYGTYGEATWTYDNQLKLLTVSGDQGQMPDNSQNSPPWTKYRTSVKKIIIEGSIISVTNNSFKDFTALSELVILEGVESLGFNVFRSCANLTSLHLPASLRSIDFSLAADVWPYITVDPNSESFSAVDGALFNKDKTELLRCPTSKSGVYSIPDHVEKIASGAFAYCKNLTGVTIPDGVTKLPSSVFENCTNLTSVDIPDGVITIGNDAFSYCEKLEEIELPGSVSTIGSSAFYGCLQLKSIVIPDSVTSVYSNVFKKCENLERVIIPESVTVIGSSAFEGCKKLEYVYLHDGITEIHSSAFSNTGITSFTFPKGFLTGNNYFRYDSLFSVAENLKSIVIIDTITKIDDLMFYKAGLESITLHSGITSIGKSAFAYTDITELVIPEGVKTIGEKAFQYCDKLLSVTIPTTVTSIGKDVFLGTTALKTVNLPCTFDESLYTFDSAVEIKVYHSPVDDGDCTTAIKCEWCESEVAEGNADHSFQNGFCTSDGCVVFEAPELKDGYYQIENGGQLFWFANHINTQDRTASAILLADIDLENRLWTPIGKTGEGNNNFRGHFNGRGYTIEGLNVNANRSGAGFFGEVRLGVVENFTIKGSVTVTANNVTYVGGVIGSAPGANSDKPEINGAKIRRVVSYVDVTVEDGRTGVGRIGGFIGYANHETIIEYCAWYGTLDLGDQPMTLGVGGFIGRVNDSSAVYIRAVAAYGKIINDSVTEKVGAFMGYAARGSNTFITDCIFAGSVSGTSASFVTPFGTWDGETKTLANSFYIDTLTTQEYDATAVSAERLASGEIAYLISGWGQNLDGNGERDALPTPFGSNVYRNQIGGCNDASFVYEYSNEEKEAVVSHADEDKNHICDNECGKINIGEHTDGDDNDHLCDYGCAQIADGGCRDANTDADHSCDECGAESVTAHADSATDGDHLCDYGCGVIIESCTPNADDGDCTTDITCSICDAVLTEGAESHTGGTATYSEKAECAVCGKSYGELLVHSHDATWVSGANEHWNECACGDKVNIASHADTNNDEKCDVCGYPMPVTRGESGTNEGNANDGNTDENDGLGTGAIVGIAAGSAAVFGVGGFSLFWFVIKKKSWADLLRAFKR